MMAIAQFIRSMLRAMGSLLLQLRHVRLLLLRHLSPPVADFANRHHRTWRFARRRVVDGPDLACIYPMTAATAARNRVPPAVGVQVADAVTHAAARGVSDVRVPLASDPLERC